jgi:hypothetical protein
MGHGMARSWWDFAEWTGYPGKELGLWQVPCGFCGEEGNFSAVAQHTKTSKAKDKSLHYDTYSCGNCGNLTMVFWAAAAGSDMHDFISVPRPKATTRHPNHWPEDVGRHWLQARRNLEGENWDSAALMARSGVQLVLRYLDAKGSTLAAQIDDLASKGILPPIMKEWSHEVRQLGNDNAHPQPGGRGTEPKDANDVVEFFNFLLTLTYDLPEDIRKYRERKK